MIEPIEYFPLNTITERQGITNIIENAPFEIKRVFFVYNVPNDCLRGGHAHKKCSQILIAFCGIVRVISGDGKNYVLDCPEIGLYVPPKNIIRTDFLSESTVLMVLASEKFNRKDYIYEG